MRTFVLFALSCFGITAVALPDAEAQCFVNTRQVFVSRPYVSAPVYYNPVQVVTQIVPVVQLAALPIATPTYTVGYSGYGNAYNGGMGQQEASALLAEIRELRGAVQQLASGGTGKAFGTNVTPKGLLVLQAKCASCHDSTVASAKAKGVALLKDGRFIDDRSTNTAGRVIEQFSTDKMPKTGAKLTDAEKFQVLLYLTTSEDAAAANQPMPPADPNKK